ncbi:hypothetical protein M3Y99_01492400 [Aphelenchoides fujianensis]|nr:hypothetical protein M3Y99_01492400 [Aphelenchoides fujianensis]
MRPAGMPTALFVLLAALPLFEGMYVARDWDLLTTDRLEQPKCVQIPRNFSLCYGMQYDQMRLPNLLEHETLEEAIQQSDAWNSLVRLNCHADTKLFLCSVFAPVCLPEMDKHIQPCKSLCEAVQQGCESRMTTYGFSWPEMLDCARFPADNDMCIRQPEVGEMRAEERAKTNGGSRTFAFDSRAAAGGAPERSGEQQAAGREANERKSELQSTPPPAAPSTSTAPPTSSRPPTTAAAAPSVTSAGPPSTASNSSRPPTPTPSSSEVKRACGSCAQVATYENLMDHFCRSSIVFKANVRAMNASHLTVQRIQRVFKPAGLQRKSPQSFARTVQLTDAAHGEHDCQCPMAANGKSRPSNNVLIMSNDQRTGGVINARLVVPWQQEKTFKSAIRKFRKVDCGALGREIRESALRKSAKFQHRP